MCLIDSRYELPAHIRAQLISIPSSERAMLDPDPPTLERNGIRPSTATIMREWAQAVECKRREQGRQLPLIEV
jgi:hypothetical protein